MRHILIFTILFIHAVTGSTEELPFWEKNTQGIYESDIRNITIHPLDNSILYAGTSKALYRSIDKGRAFKSILRPQGEKTGVNYIYISRGQPEIIYAATDAGLYESQNDGESWEKIYFSSDAKERICLSVLKDNKGIYLGTKKGLFYKFIEETNWIRIKENFDQDPVYRVIEDEKYVYFSTGNFVFSKDKEAGNYKKIFSLGSGEIGEESKLINFIQVTSEASHQSKSGLVIAAANGIYIRWDDKEKWHRLSSSSIPFEDVTALIVFRNDRGMLAGTKRGVYFGIREKWIPVYTGMETNEISYLAKDSQDRIYAATNRGVFSMPAERLTDYLENDKETNFSHRRSLKDIENIFGNEPNINDVHQWAIDYAEVGNDKIKDWRALARKRALLPDVSVGVDRDGSDLYHWNTGANPDELQKGRAYIDWDVSVSWDLADLIWSTDQTTIDSRSKLMVELREDILDQATRLFFERRRLQIELLDHDSEESMTMKMDKEMRVAELTALINAFTGGKFSKLINSNKNTTGQ